MHPGCTPPELSLPGCLPTELSRLPEVTGHARTCSCASRIAPIRTRDPDRLLRAPCAVHRASGFDDGFCGGLRGSLALGLFDSRSSDSQLRLPAPRAHQDIAPPARSKATERPTSRSAERCKPTPPSRRSSESESESRGSQGQGPVRPDPTAAADDWVEEGQGSRQPARLPWSASDRAPSRRQPANMRLGRVRAASSPPCS